MTHRAATDRGGRIFAFHKEKMVDSGIFGNIHSCKWHQSVV